MDPQDNSLWKHHFHKPSMSLQEEYCVYKLFLSDNVVNSFRKT